MLLWGHKSMHESHRFHVTAKENNQKLNGMDGAKAPSPLETYTALNH